MPIKGKINENYDQYQFLYVSRALLSLIKQNSYTFAVECVFTSLLNTTRSPSLPLVLTFCLHPQIEEVSSTKALKIIQLMASIYRLQQLSELSERNLQLNVSIKSGLQEQ